MNDSVNMLHQNDFDMCQIKTANDVLCPLQYCLTNREE